MDKIKKMSEITKPLFQNISGEYSMLSAKTGFASVDKLIGKLYQKEICCVASRPGMGKTTFIINIALNIAWSSDIPVYVFSRNLTAEDIALRMITIKTEIGCGEMKKSMSGEKTIGDKEKEKLLQWSKLIEETNINFIDSVFDFDEIQDFIKERIRNACIFFTDDMRDICKNGDIAVRKLKEIARETSSIVFFESGLPRTTEARKDRRPQLSDLSDGIQAFSDTVLLLYRKAYYDTDNPCDYSDINLAEIIVGKGSKGLDNICFVEWRDNTCSFADLEYAKKI